jgi:hypothetical protein
MELNAEQVRYKMSEKQIKTALECLSKPNSSPADREKCYFMWKEPSCFSCYHEVAQNALALITSQEQRIKELGEEVERRKNQYLSLVESHNRTCDYLNTKDVEMAKLTEENERLRDTAYRLEGEVHRERADTVMKMHSKLCEGRVSNDNVVIVANQVAKEMLEGEK